MSFKCPREEFRFIAGGSPSSYATLNAPWRIDADLGTIIVILLLRDASRCKILGIVADRFFSGRTPGGEEGRSD